MINPKDKVYVQVTPQYGTGKPVQAKVRRVVTTEEGKTVYDVSSDNGYYSNIPAEFVFTSLTEYTNSKMLEFTSYINKHGTITKNIINDMFGFPSHDGQWGYYYTRHKD